MDWIRRWTRNRALIAVLALVVASAAVSDRSTEGVGDVLQVTLPLSGLGCAIAGGQGLRYTGRYVLMTVGYNISKEGLGDAGINRRPGGGDRGFPSGHTTVAAYGAAGMIQTCLAGNPQAQVAAGLAAGLVGGTRIDAGAHDVWQVLAGAILGWVMQIAALNAFDAWFRRVWFGAGRGLLRLIRAVRDGVEGIAGTRR